MLQPGQVVDRYEVEAAIGQGGSATVYRIRHRVLGTRHALKFLAAADSPFLVRRILTEGRVQAGLRHPNILAVTDVLEVDGEPALVMDYVDGPTLEEWCRRGPSPIDASVRLFRGVVKGIRHAHAHGVVHRDLKPSNVLVGREGRRLVPKVADFGIARSMDAVAPGDRTRSGVFLGTPEYASPEQIVDASSVDQRADLFSLGALIYRMVCGTTPFPGTHPAAVMQAIRAGTYVPVERIVPDAPEPVCRVIRGLLVLDPDRRLQNCDEVLDILDGHAIDAAPASMAGPMPGVTAPPSLDMTAPASLPMGGGWVALLDVHGVSHAIPLDDVRGVFPYTTVTPLPQGAPHVLGLVPNGDGVTTLMSLAVLLGLRPASRTPGLALRGDGDRRWACALDCDPLPRIVRLPADAIAGVRVIRIGEQLRGGIGHARAS